MIQAITRPNKPLLLRVLILLVAILVLVMSPLSALAEAHAIAELAALLPASAAAPVVLVVAILIAGGAVFNNWLDACKAGVKIWDVIKLDAAVSAEVAGLSNPLTTLTSVLGYAIKVSPQLWQRVIGQFKKQFAPTPGAISGGWTHYKFDLAAWDSALADSFNAANFHAVKIGNDVYTMSSDKSRTFLCKNGQVVSDRYVWVIDPLRRFSVSKTSSGVDVAFEVWDVSGTYFSGYRFYDSSVSPFDIAVDGFVSFSGSIAAPSDDYLVKVPDIPNEADSDGKIAVPPYPLNPTDWRVGTADLPDVFGGTTVADLPFDKVIDMSTGKTIEGEINPPMPPIPPGLPDFGGLSIPAAIADKFPFCIPFVLADLVGLLAAEPVEPVFHIPFKVPGLVDEEFVLDFSKFGQLVEIIRWGELICFVGGLAYVTRNYIKW